MSEEIAEMWADIIGGSYRAKEDEGGSYYLEEDCWCAYPQKLWTPQQCFVEALREHMKDVG